MAELEHEGRELGRIHRASNEIKYFCHFTGFLEGIAASGYIEAEELRPLLEESKEFLARVADVDAYDIIEDFDANILEHETILDAVKYRLEKIDSTCPKSSLNRFLGFCRGIVCDGKITKAEAQALLSKIKYNKSLLSVVGVQQVQVTCLDALSDGILTEDEEREICRAIGDIVGDSYGDTGIAQTDGVANYREKLIVSISKDLSGRSVVLTGKFSIEPRSEFEALLSEFEVEFARSVSKKTDYLIIGGQASRDWIELNRGTKLRKAQELRLTSHKPHFISESQILRLLKSQ